MARARRRRSRLALTERCRTPKDLVGTLLGGLASPELARHLKRCAACRKVLADYLRGQAFPAEYFTPDPATLAWARAAVAARGGGAAAPDPPGAARFRVRLADPVEVEGPESAPAILPPKKGGVTRVRTRALGHSAEILLEPLAPGRILLRYRGTPPGAVVTLAREGKPLGKGQKGDAYWRDLGPGTYELTLLSGSAPRALHLLLSPG